MIFGRPTGLWLGVLTAATGAVTLTFVAFGYDAQLVTTIVGAWSVVLGAIISLVANQPPTINPGDTVTVTTPKGEANRTVTVA